MTLLPIFILVLTLNGTFGAHHYFSTTAMRRLFSKDLEITALFDSAVKNPTMEKYLLEYPVINSLFKKYVLVSFPKSFFEQFYAFGFAT